jgi:NAD(P)-dependent dehydrogenase (short-subunit alcohol dehydrogenase family)
MAFSLWDFCQLMLDFFERSPYLVTFPALLWMKLQRWGRIVNITSEVDRDSDSPFSAYVAAEVAHSGSAGTAFFTP